MIKYKQKLTILRERAESGFALISAVAVLALLLVMVLAFATASIFEQRMANNNANTANNKALQNSVANMVCNLLNRNGQYPIKLFLPEDGSTGKLIINPINDAIKENTKYQGLEVDSNLAKILEHPGIYDRSMTGMWDNPADDFKWLMLRDSDQDQVISRLAFVLIPNYGIGVTTYLNSDDSAEGDANELRKGRNVEEIDAAWILTGNAADHTTMLDNFANNNIKFSNISKYLDVTTFFSKVYNLDSINRDMAESDRKNLVAMNHYYSIPSTRVEEAFYEVENTGTAEAPAMTTKAYHRFNLARNWDALYAAKPADESSLPDYENLKQRKPDELVLKLLSTSKDEWKANEKIKDDKATSIPWFQDAKNSYTGKTDTKEVKQFAANIADYFDSDLMPSSDVHPKFWALSNSAMSSVYETPSDENKNTQVTFGDDEADKLKSGSLDFTGVEAVPAILRSKLFFKFSTSLSNVTPPTPDDPTAQYTYSVIFLAEPQLQMQLGMLFGSEKINAELEKYNIKLDVFIEGEAEIKSSSGLTQSFKFGNSTDPAADNFHFYSGIPLTSYSENGITNYDLSNTTPEPIIFDNISGSATLSVSLKNFKIKRMVLSGIEIDKSANILGWDFVNELTLPDAPDIVSFTITIGATGPEITLTEQSVEYVVSAKDPLANLLKDNWHIPPKASTTQSDMKSLDLEFTLPSSYKTNFGIEKLTDSKLQMPLPHRSGESYKDRKTTDAAGDADKISFMELNFIHQGEENKFFNLAAEDNNNVTILDYLKLEDLPSNYKVNISLLTKPLFQELFEKIHVHLTPEESENNLHTFNVDNLADSNPKVAYRLGENPEKTPTFSNGDFSMPEIPDITETDQAKAQQQINSRGTVLRDYLLKIYPGTTLTDMERSEIIAKTANLVNTNYIVTKDATGTLSAYTPFPGYTLLAVIQNVKERERLINGKKDFIVLTEKKIKADISGNNGKYRINSIQNLPIPLP